MKTITIAILNETSNTEILVIEETDRAVEILVGMAQNGTNSFDNDEYEKLNVVSRKEVDFELLTEYRG